MLLRTALPLLVAVLMGCAGPRHAALPPAPSALVLQTGGPTYFRDWGHAPLRVLDDAAVRFRVSATSDAGVRSAELYVYEYELYRDRAGAPSQRRRDGGVWGRVAAFSHPGAPADFSAEHTHAPSGLRPCDRVAARAG